MEQDFLKEVELEVHDVIRRLSNHPSIVLWSGNNENQVCSAHILPLSCDFMHVI